MKRSKLFAAMLAAPLGLALSMSATGQVPSPQPPGQAQPQAGQPAAGGHQEHLDHIAPFVGADSIGIGHLDLARLDLKATSNWCENVIGAIKTDPKGQDKDQMAQAFKQNLDNAEGWVAKMREAGAKDLFVVVGPARDGDMPLAAIVVPLAENAKADQIQSLLQVKGPDGKNMPDLETATMHNAVVLAPKDKIGAFKDAKPGDVKMLGKALASVSDSAVHFAFKPVPELNDVLGRMKVALSEKARKELEQGNLKGMPEKLNWFAFGMQSPPQPNLKMVFEAADAKAAQQMASDFEAVLQDAKQNKQLQAQVTNLDQFVNAMKPQVRGEQVSISLSSEQIERLVQGGQQEGQAQPASAKPKGEEQQPKDQPKQ